MTKLKFRAQYTKFTGSVNNEPDSKFKKKILETRFRT